MRSRVSCLKRRMFVTAHGSNCVFLHDFKCIGRILLIALTFACLSLAATFTSAQAYSPPKASLIIDANSGKVLHASNARAERYPASLTKVMTLYIVFEYLRDGRLDMDTRLTVSAAAAKRPPSKVGFKPGDSLPVRAAIRLLVTKSANDVAAVVAENIAGSEASFAKLMTRKARAMGMKDTTFHNASGLPDSRQKTTAHDMAILARRVLSDFPEYADEFKRRYFKFRGKTYRSHNRLLFHYDGIQGLKTGFIRASGFNVMIAAQRGGKRVFGVVMGGRSARARDARARRLLDAAWRKASVRAPEMAAHLPRRNPVFRPSERELKIRHRLASAEGSPRALLFKQMASLSPTRRATPRRIAPRRKIQARLSDVPGSAPGPAVEAEPTRRVAARQRPAQPRGSAEPEGLPGPYHVQVGAYVSAEDARRRLATVVSRNEAQLRGYPREALHAEVRGRTVFRARFGGFEETRARQICDRLKQKSIDCLVTAKN